MTRCISLLTACLILLVLVSAGEALPAEMKKAPGVKVHYRAENENYAEVIIGRLPSIRARVAARTGLSSDMDITVVIYKDRDEFLKSTSTDMIAAFAVPDDSRIVLDLTRMRVHPLNMELIIMHELSHLVLHRYIRDSELPKWFDEGVSEWVSGISEIIAPDRSDILKKAVIGGSMIPLYRIRAVFPDDRQGFALAYEESRSMIEFIAQKYGEGSVRGIIGRLKDGETFNTAIRSELSLSIAELEAKWLNDLDIRNSWVSYISNNIYWLLFMFGSVIIIAGFIRLRWRIKHYRDDEEEDEIEMLERMYRDDEEK